MTLLKFKSIFETPLILKKTLLVATPLAEMGALER